MSHDVDPVPENVRAAVKRMVVRESRLAIAAERVADDEPLDGPLLRVTSLGLLGMLIRLEDELDVTLPDDLFTGRQVHTVADLAALVASACPPRAERALTPGGPA
ncbi:acyl carrier protein [Micromonospora sp. KLBMP9576]|uniref:acyl carrier protein n=1 Tax=Micromonospora sp. KLBMP9576 TaxID=3424769 RepID=UPI003D8BCA15